MPQRGEDHRGSNAATWRSSSAQRQLLRRYSEAAGRRIRDSLDAIIVAAEL